jgi:hypothetical protein
MSRAVSHTFKTEVILMSIMILDVVVDVERSPRGVRGGKHELPYLMMHSGVKHLAVYSGLSFFHDVVRR